MYTIKKTNTKITDLYDSAWDAAEVAVLEQINWPDVCTHNPGMQARILYSDFGIHIKMTTQEKPIVARETKQNGNVYMDSCMEFFFRPNENDARYLNFEFNAFGTMYLAIRTNRNDPVHPSEDKRYFGVVSDVTEDEWSLMFTVPFEFIDREFGNHTKTIYGNLFKCGDKSQHLHYVTYYPIRIDVPDYHRPDFFDKFILE